MAKLINVVDVSSDSGHSCFQCKETGVDTPASHSIFYDVSVGSFADHDLPRMCERHADQLGQLTTDQRKQILKRFALRSDAAVGGVDPLTQQVAFTPPDRN